MEWLVPCPEEIPAALRALGWILWRAERRAQGKPTKVPYKVTTPSVHASSTDPSTWSSFQDAVDAYSAIGADGIGVVLTDQAYVTCIDLDHVIAEDRTLDARAQTIVELCDSWTEISPSGTGLHVFVHGRTAEALKAPQIEVYSTARYIAVTGHRWPGTPDLVRPQQQYIDHLVSLARQAAMKPRSWTGPSTPPPDDLVGALTTKLESWGIRGARLKRWGGGVLVELAACPWASDHTTGEGGAAVILHPSGAYDFTCLHAHCAGRTWRDFRAAMESRV